MYVKMNTFPLEIRDVDPETAAFMDSLTDADYGGYVRVGPKGYFFPKAFEKEAANVYNMDPKPGQVVITGHARSGTTLTQQIMWLILNVLNYTDNEKTTMAKEYELIEVKMLLPRFVEDKDNMAAIAALNERKIKFDNLYIKTHLPLSLLPPKILETSKVVYVARDPRDTFVSFYNYSKGLLFPYKSDFKTSWKAFKNGMTTYGPYFEGVKEGWEKRNHPNLLFLFYEDLLNDKRLSSIRRISEFLGKKYTDKQILGLSQYVEIENMRKKKTCDASIVLKPDQSKTRKGGSGGWRNYFDEEMTREADQWMLENLSGTDLRYPTVKLSL